MTRMTHWYLLPPGSYAFFPGTHVAGQVHKLSDREVCLIGEIFPQVGQHSELVLVLWPGDESWSLSTHGTCVEYGVTDSTLTQTWSLWTLDALEVPETRAELDRQFRARASDAAPPSAPALPFGPEDVDLGAPPERA